VKDNQNLFDNVIYTVCMDTRNSPVVTVTSDHIQNLTERQIGSRILAALAHTPARRDTYSYHAIAVSKTETIELTAEEVVEETYDLYLSQKLRLTDERRIRVGTKLINLLTETEKKYVIIGRS